MKNNSVKKLLSVALVGTMAASMLAGCGSEDTTSTSNSGSTTTSTTSSSSSSSTTEVEKPAEPVDIVIPVYQRATPNGAADAANNYWTQYVIDQMKEQYNVNVTFRAYERGKENELYAKDAAAQDLPTICFEYDYPDLTSYYSEGYLASYDKEWFKSVAPTYWQNMVDNSLDGYTDIDGDTVLVIGSRPYGNTNYQFTTFYRLDWVKAAGYDEWPNDPAEVEKMYDKIIELGLPTKDVDGKYHILGGVKTGGNGADQNYAYRKQPQDELTWATTGDYSVPALSTDAQKAMLKAVNHNYNKGYIRPDFNQYESAQSITDFVNGVCITYSCYSTNHIDVLDQLYANFPDAELAIQVNPGPKTYSDGSTSAFRPNSIFGEYIGFSSQATEEQKTAAAQYLEWLAQPANLEMLQWGIEGVNYEVVNGEKQLIADQAGKAEQQGHNNNVDMWCLFTATRTSGDVDKDMMAITPLGYKDSDAFAKQIKANYEGQKACFDAGYARMDAMFTVGIAASDEYKDTLFTKYAELRDNVVTGSEADFDANYEKASKEYLEAGYQAIIDEKAAAYKAGKVN